VPGKLSVDAQIAAVQQQIAQMQSQASIQQMQTVMISQKADLHEFLHRQHDLWDADLTAYLTAILMAQQDFHDIMEQKTPPSLLASLIGSALTVLIFAVAPELLPFKKVAEKLEKSEESLKLLTKAVTDLTKESVEVFKKKAETTESNNDREAGNSLAIRYFGNLFKHVNEQKNGVANAINSLSQWLDEPADAIQLGMRIPMIKDKWNRSTYSRPDGTPANTDASQLSLVFLYDIMRQYCKNTVELKAPILMTDPKELNFLSTPSDAMKFDAKISKAEFQRRRAADPSFDVEFEGLDSARRKRMYEKFAQIRWQDPKCPPIRNWLELIDKWEFKEE